MRSTPEKKARISDTLAASIEKDTKEQGLASENEWMINAFEHFLTCKKTEQIAGMKLMVLKYDGHCIKGDHEVKAGDWAYYGRGVGVICLDCAISQGLGDKTLVTKYLKLREYQRLVKALKNEADRLADKVEGLTVADRFENIEKMNADLHKLVMGYLKGEFANDKERNILEEIEKLSAKLSEALNEFEQFMERVLQIKRRVKQPQSMST